MKTYTKLTVLLLALCLLCSAFVACSGDGNEPATTTGAQTGDQATKPQDQKPEAPDQGEEALMKPAQNNYDYDFTILTNDNGDASRPNWIYEENKPSGEVISNALYHRQQIMEELYGVTLHLKKESDYNTLITNNASSGDYVFDVSMIPAVDTIALACKGAYANVLDLDHSLNLEASYWDQRIQKEYRINDMLFTLEGDFSYVDEMRTLVVIYNDSIYSMYDYYNTYGSPYSLVENNTWTYSVMMEMIKDMADNSNHDDVMNENDTWGMVSERTAVYYFFLGAGLKTMENNNGELTLLLTDRTYYQTLYDVIESTLSMAGSPDVIMVNAPGAVSDSSQAWTFASNIFEYDRALFRTTTLSAVTRLLDMESDYGILPVPAYFEDQTEYYCWVSGNTAMPMAISDNVEDIRVTAEIVERLGYHSRYGSDTLYSAFFDQMAYSRICRTQDDIKMLELVMESKTYDLDQVTKITGVEPKLYTLAGNKNFGVLSSTMATLVETAESNLNKYLIEMIAGNT